MFRKQQFTIEQLHKILSLDSEMSSTGHTDGISGANVCPRTRTLTLSGPLTATRKSRRSVAGRLSTVSRADEWQGQEELILSHLCDGVLIRVYLRVTPRSSGMRRTVVEWDEVTNGTAVPEICGRASWIHDGKSAMYRMSPWPLSRPVSIPKAKHFQGGLYISFLPERESRLVLRSAVSAAHLKGYSSKIRL